MAAKRADGKEVLASTSSNIVNKIHKMQWLKQDSQLMTEKFVSDSILKDLPSKKDQEYFSGTKSTKKKKEKKHKPTKTIGKLTDIVASETIESMDSETTEKSIVPICKKSNENMIPNANQIQSNVANPWNQNTNVVDTLFPNIQSTTIRCMNEAEMLSAALAESIATAQLEYYRKESNEQKTPPNKSTDSDDDGEWGVVKRNLPDPEENTDMQPLRNPCDTNNNDNTKDTKCSLDKEIQAKFSSSESCKHKDLEGKSGTVKPFLLSSVEPSVENSNDKRMEDVDSLKKHDVDDPTKSKDIQVFDEKSDLVAQPSTSSNIDKYGRVGGYTERHLFMGRGARRKEQEYFNEHGAALGLIKLKDQNSNRALPKKSEDTKKTIKPSDYGFFKKSEINRYQESNQIYKSGSGSDSVPADFRYSRGNDKHSENRYTRRDDFSSRNKIHGELRSIRGTGINLQKMKEQDTADSHNPKVMDSIDNKNRGMKFQRSHETQTIISKKNDLNSTKNKFANDIIQDERSTSTPEPKENLPESSSQKSKTDKSLTSAVPDTTTTEFISSHQNFNNSLIQNTSSIQSAKTQLMNDTEGHTDANLTGYTDINNVINNDSNKLSAQSCLSNDELNQIIDSPNSQINHLPIASSSMHEQIEPSEEYYCQQSMQNLKDLQYLQYLQYLHQQCKGTKSENYDYPDSQSQAVQSVAESFPFPNSQYVNLPGLTFPDSNYLLANIQQSNTMMQTAPARFSPTQSVSLNVPGDNQFANFSHAANVTFPSGYPAFLSYQNAPVQSMQRDNIYQECGGQANFSTGLNQLDYLTALMQNSENPMRNFANVVQNPFTDLRYQSYLQAQQTRSLSSEFYQTDNNIVRMTSARNLRERANLPETPVARSYSEFCPRGESSNDSERIENCTRAPPGYKILGANYEKDNQILPEQKRVIVDNFGIRLPSFHANKEQFCEVPQANPMQNFGQLPQDAQSLMTLLLNAQVSNQLDNNSAGNSNYYDQSVRKSNKMDYTQSIPYQFQMNSTNPGQIFIPNLQMAKIPHSFGTMKIANNSGANNSLNDSLANEQCGIPPMISPLSCMNYKTSKDSTTAYNLHTTSASVSRSNTDSSLGIHTISMQNSHPLTIKDPGNKYKNVSTRSIGRGRSSLLKSKNL